MQIGMCELAKVSAGLTRSTRRIFMGAEKQLGKPERETLLTDASLSLEKEARRQGAGAGAFRQTLSYTLMSVQLDYRHAEICLIAVPAGLVKSA
jgi:hypothetical protein